MFDVENICYNLLVLYNKDKDKENTCAHILSFNQSAETYLAIKRAESYS